MIFNVIFKLTIASLIPRLSQASETHLEVSAELGTCALQTKTGSKKTTLLLSSEDGATETNETNSTLISKCKFEVMDMDFATPDKPYGGGDDGYEYIVCHDQESNTTHYLQDDNVTSELQCGDLLTVVLEEIDGASHGKHQSPWERENKSLYRVVQVQERVPTSVLEMERREKYGLEEHVNYEKKTMDILMVVCNYDDWQVEGTDDLINALHHYPGALSYDESLNLSSFGRLSAPRSTAKFVNVSMGKTLASVVGGVNGTGCAFDDCFHTARAKIPEQYPGVDMDAFTFREFFIPYQDGSPGSCGWAGLANVGCGRFDKLPNPGACWTYNCYIGAWLRRHELGHNQGIIHPRSFRFKEFGQTSWSDRQEFMFGGANSWNRLELWQMGILRDEMPDVFTWKDANPAVISLGSMSLPFEETGAEAASAKIPCRCCQPVVNPHPEDWGGLDYWLQYRGKSGRYDGWGFFAGKVMVHLGHKTRGDGEFVAILSLGETYNPPNSPMFIHACANSTDAMASVSMAYSQEEAKALCPGAAPRSEKSVVRTVAAEPELGFPGLVCDFPVSYDGIVRKDCFQRQGRNGTWCTSGRAVVETGCNEDYDGNGGAYRGCQNVTRKGYMCQRWDSKVPHHHNYGPERFPDAGLESNYCRNPGDGEPTVWCYTTDLVVKWDYCDTLGPKYLTCASTPETPYYPSCSVTDGSDVSSTYPCQCGDVQCTSGRKCVAATSSCEFTCDETFSGDGALYVGCQNKTHNGIPCQRWDATAPHKISWYYHDDSAGNFCRNPDGGSRPWCYTTDPGTRWDYCDPLPVVNPQQPRPAQPTDPHTCFPVLSGNESGPATSLLPTTTAAGATTTAAVTTTASSSTSSSEATATTCDENETTVSGNGEDYRGCLNVTKSGYTCQRWDSQSPHSHNYTPEQYPDGGLDSNYCRNPAGDPTLWCYTTSDERWEYCNPSRSSSEATTATCDEDETSVSGNGEDYRGCMNVTKSGYTCQRWDSQSPHSHSYTPEQYPDGGLDSNYCRNPDGDPGIWCYTTSDERWEYCTS